MTRTSASGAGSPGGPTPRPWPPKVRQFVQDEQEDAYRLLATSLGLGADPLAAYRHLARPQMPVSHVLPSRRKGEFGGQLDLDEEDWQRFDQAVTGTWERYAGTDPPTTYEDPNWYPMMAMVLDLLVEGVTRRGTPLTTAPFAATLPSGDVNGRAVVEPAMGTPIVFIEQGLFRYLYDFALLIGWTVLPLSLAQLHDDNLLTGLPRRHTMPFEASNLFIGTLGAYAIEGSPKASPDPLPKPGHNPFVPMILVTYMEWFVLAHELAHLTLGHLAEPPGLAQEYAADAAAVALVCDMIRADGGSVATGYWACDLALSAFQLLEHTIGLFGLGPVKLSWVSTTHPDPLSRRTRLREWLGAGPKGVPKVAIAAATELLGMSDALLWRLSEISNSMFVAQPMVVGKPLPPLSPVWEKHLAHNMIAKT